MNKPSVAVHKFSSCDGCQLAFLNMGEDLLALSELVDIRHFLEAGMSDEHAQVDIAFIEGSISTSDELNRLQHIRKNSKKLVSIGACATSGGIQALRNMANTGKWVDAIYASPEYINILDKVSPIAEHVKVDFELWGCPVSSTQVLATVRAYLNGVVPKENSEKVCMECKRRQSVCTLVTRGESCLGPVTKAGCGAICPSFGRGCYACYGPSTDCNTTALANRLQGLGLSSAEVVRQFSLFNNNAPMFRNLINKIHEQKNE